MKKYLILWVLTLSLLTPSVWALTLDEARTQGRVGETLNGYLVALKNDAGPRSWCLILIMPAAPVISS